MIINKKIMKYKKSEQNQITFQSKIFLKKKDYDVDNNETSEEQNSLKYKQNKKEKEEEVEEVEDEDINNKDKDYQNKTDKSIEKILSNYKNLSIKEKINNLNRINKIIKYGDIFVYLYNKKYNNDINLYPRSIKIISDMNKRNNKKRKFRRSYKNFEINKDNRLIQKRKYRNIFDGKIYVDYFLIITIEEFENIIKMIHDKNGHRGIKYIINEFKSKNLYCKGLESNIINYIKNCKVCSQNKNNIFVKPPNKQIISKYPMERILLDITYLTYKDNKNNCIKKYILNIVDHFSKFDYSFVQNSKSSKEVLDNFKIYLEKCGIPKNVQTDNGGEFVNKEFQKFYENKGITLIHGAPRHPQSQGAVEAFNNTFKKLFSVLIHDPNYKFNLNQIVLNINNIYNNSIHSTTKISPLSAFKTKNNNIKK